MATGTPEPREEFRPFAGPLEIQVMEILWSNGECTVRQVMHRLPPKLAYTTVMTILVRLFGKGWLQRRKLNRQFAYWPCYTAEQWQKSMASAALERFLATPRASRAMLAAALWDTLSQKDPGLLLEIERQIQRKRREQEYFRLVRPEI